jgi:potassium-transporting ATPase KdpC subunit
MLTQLRPALVSFVIFTLITGVAYPLAVTGIARVFFPRQAAGSLIEKDGVVIGSELIGQSFNSPGYFKSRPSATSPEYNASASSGSNLGPTNPALLDAVKSRVETAREGGQSDVPVDLVTSSGSGLDPHISPAAAYNQVDRVAKARGLSAQQVRSLVEARIEGRTVGVLGEPRVNVLGLNLALDALPR